MFVLNDLTQTVYSWTLIRTQAERFNTIVFWNLKMLTSVGGGNHIHKVVDSKHKWEQKNSIKVKNAKI